MFFFLFSIAFILGGICFLVWWFVGFFFSVALSFLPYLVNGYGATCMHAV